MPEKNSELKDPREWVKDLDIESTEDIAVPKMLVDQVIGQEQGSGVGSCSSSFFLFPNRPIIFSILLLLLQPLSRSYFYRHLS